MLHAAMGSPARFWFAEKLLAKGADINAAYIRMYYGSQAMWETRCWRRYAKRPSKT